jgi:dCMP deaminase
MEISTTVNERVNFIKVTSHLHWDEYFMLQAMMASYKSKDPNTKVGCVFVDALNHQISMGYNGAVAGIDESQIPWGNDRRVPLEMQKYGYVIHSEANAISHAKASLAGSKAYVTLFPCNECAKLIATHRVTEVIYLSDKYQDTPEIRMSKHLFDLSGVKYRQLRLEESLIEGLCNHLQSLLPDTRS